MNEKIKTYIFVDAANVWSVQKSKAKLINWSVFKKNVQTLLKIEREIEIEVKKIFYYEAYPEKSARTYDTDSKHKFFTWLSKGLKFIVRKKQLKTIFSQESTTKSFEKGNMDVELVIDSMHNKEEYNIAIFFTGDSDFLPLITYLKNRDKKCFIFSSKNQISSELQTGGDGYFDIKKYPSFWGNKLEYRNKKKQPS